jgi:hypothetical protein
MFASVDDDTATGQENEAMDTNIEVIEGEIMSATDTLLDDLDLEIIVGEEASDAEVIAAMTSEDEAAIDILVETDAAHTAAAADSVIDVATTAPVTAKPKKERKAAAAKAPKAERDPANLPAEMFVLDTSAVPADLDANKAHVLTLCPQQKKIAEKFDNLFTAIAAGKKPSVYTMVCFDVLSAKGSATSIELIAALKATASRSGGAYNDGTARSQVGQMMALFHAVGIATRSGNTLTFNATSKIAERLKAL